ncbi:hypothetical protein D3C74_468270 [compost metagenome]
MLRKITSSGHQAFRLETMTVFGFWASTARPPKPYQLSVPVEGLMFVQAPLVVLNFQTSPLLPSYGPTPLL